MSENNEECVKHLFDNIGFYVRESARVEVLRVLVPYVRKSDLSITTQSVAEKVAAWQMNDKVRPGFYKFVDELRNGNWRVTVNYNEEFV